MKKIYPRFFFRRVPGCAYHLGPCARQGLRLLRLLAVLALRVLPRPRHGDAAAAEDGAAARPRLQRRAVTGRRTKEQRGQDLKNGHGMAWQGVDYDGLWWIDGGLMVDWWWIDGGLMVDWWWIDVKISKMGGCTKLEQIFPWETVKCVQIRPVAFLTQVGSNAFQPQDALQKPCKTPSGLLSSHQCVIYNKLVCRR